MSKSQNPTKGVIPIMKKRIYRRMPVNDFQPESISPADLGGKLVFAIDVAKVDMVAALASADGRVLHTICWKAPEHPPTVLSILRGVRAAGVTVEAVMEPSGTYGDVLRHQLEQDAFPVFMVSGKRTYDAKEIFDGHPACTMPSQLPSLPGCTQTACPPLCPTRSQKPPAQGSPGHHGSRPGALPAACTSLGKLARSSLARVACLD